VIGDPQICGMYRPLPGCILRIPDDSHFLKDRYSREGQLALPVRDSLPVDPSPNWKAIYFVRNSYTLQRPLFPTPSIARVLALYKKVFSRLAETDIGNVDAGNVRPYQAAHDLVDSAARYAEIRCNRGDRFAIPVPLHNVPYGRLGQLRPGMGLAATNIADGFPTNRSRGTRVIPSIQSIVDSGLRYAVFRS